MQLQISWTKNKCYVAVVQYVRHCLSRGQIPELMLMSREGLFSNLPKNVLAMPSYIQRGELPQNVSQIISFCGLMADQSEGSDFVFWAYCEFFGRSLLVPVRYRMETF